MAGIIAKRTIEEIRLRSDVVDVVGSHLTLQRSGSTFKTLCPFHKEKTPSFYVNPERQIFHCFGCGAGGDVFRFIMQYEAVDFVTAAKMLATRAGVNLEFDEGGEDRASEKDLLYRLMNEVAEFYQRILFKSAAAEHAWRYLKERDLPEEVVKEFMVGYVPDRWDSVITWAQKKKTYTVGHLEAAGLVIKSTKEGSAGRYYDRFRNRIMFPIRDGQGRIVGFSGRILGSEEGGAKYVNSPETALFHKSATLYGLYEAKRTILEKHEAIVCEGQIDLIRCHQAGFRNAVAVQGTAFTEDHARILKRCADSVVLVFDSDRAGQDAAVKTGRVFMRSGFAVRVARLPDDEDPDSFIRKQGAAAFQAMLDASSSVVEFQVTMLRTREDMRTDAGVMRIARAVLETVAEAGSSVQRARLIQQAAELLNVPVRALEEDMRRAVKTPYAAASADAKQAPPKAPYRPTAEVQLAEHILKSPDLGKLVEKYLPLKFISDPKLAAIIKCAIQAGTEKKLLVSVLSDVDDPDGEITRLAVQLQEAPDKTVGGESSREDAVRDLILRIRRREVERQRDELVRRIDSGEEPGDEARVRRVQLTTDLKILEQGKWETALLIMDLDSIA